jgi:hypothetical protein
MKNSLRIIAILAAFAILQSPVLGADSESSSKARLGTIKGRVSDIETKSPIVGATVRILNSETGAYADTDGNFVIKKVPVGTYSLQFSSVGFEPTIKNDIIVRSDRITFVDAEIAMSEIRFKSVKVAAGSFHRIQEQPTSATNFNGEEIRRSPGSAGDVSRIVSILPSVAKVNDMMNSLAVRGGSPTENAFYVDNIEIPNINHYPIQGTSGGPIGLLNVDFIDNVNFSAGGFSAAYGDRLSSVMEIDFREGNRDEFDTQIDMNMAGFGLVAEGPIHKDKGSIMFSGRRSYLDLLVDAIGTGVAPRYSDYQGKAVYDLSSSNRISLLGIYGHDNITFDRESSTDEKLPFYGPFKGSEYAFGANWRYLWNKNGYSNTSVSALGTKYDQNVFETFAPDSIDPWVYTNVSREDMYQIRNVNHYRFHESISSEFGFDVKYFHNDYYTHSAAYTNAIGDSIPGTLVDKILDATKYGAYGSLNVRPWGRLSATLGVRYDYYPYVERWHVSPRFSLTYNPSARTTLKCATGIYYQSIPIPLLMQKTEFEKLRDPIAYHYVAGVDYLLTPETKLTVEGYYKKYDNFPMDPAQPMLFLADEVSFQRIVGIFEELSDKGQAESYGVEMTVQKKLAREFYGLAAGSFARARYRGLDGIWRDRLFDNKYMFSVEGGYKPNNKWEFSIRWILAGGPPYTPIDPAASDLVGRTVFSRDRVNEERLQPYHSMNLRVDRRYHFSHTNLIVYLSVWNVYNRKNVSMYYWNVPDKKVDKIFQWSTLPVAGFELEF